MVLQKKWHQKAKALLESNLVKDVKDTKKAFFKYTNNRRKTKDNVGPWQNGAGTLVTEDAGKAELPNAFMPSSLHLQDQPSGISDPGDQVKGCWKEDLSLVREDWVREHLGKSDIHKSMGSQGMHPQRLRELVDATGRPLTVIFERSWTSGEVPEDWEEANVTPVLQKGKE